MKARYSITLLLQVLLLVFASEVLAASAWVLWVREERLWNPKGGHWGSQKISWDVLGGFSSETECRRRLRETIERVTHPDYHRDDEDVMYKVTGDTVTLLFYPKGAKPADTTTRSQILHYACLPDTVDQRQPSKRN